LTPSVIAVNPGQFLFNVHALGDQPKTSNVQQMNMPAIDLDDARLLQFRNYAADIGLIALILLT
jgi:hypothetical protein